MNENENTQDIYIASDIYERMEANEKELGGSVEDDLAEILASGDFWAFEDYFGDQDPFAYL